jgi:phenylalanyl-tRNA synthetase alpha chain
MKYRLTQEGLNYLNNGLPELNLVKLLEKKKEVEIKEVKKEIENFDIALMWAKKNGWVKIEKNKLILLKKPESYELQEILKRFAEGEEIEEKYLEILLKRKLIEKVDLKVEELRKKFRGKTLTEIQPEILKYGIWKEIKFQKYDVNVPSKKITYGKIHFWNEFVREIKEKLIALGFEEVRGPLVELNFWNCDTLFMPSDHPARSIHDIFELKFPCEGKILDKKLWERVKKTHLNGWKTESKGWAEWNFELAKKLILRSHTTSVSSRVLSRLNRFPYKMFTIDRVFRPDVIDAKHFIEFHQLEGIVVDKNLNFKHLLGYLKLFAKMILETEKVKFKPAYFPFTEPSVEGLIHHPKFGWIEVFGAGIFRPEVTLPLGIKKEYKVLAWGIGITRLAMVKYKINDIREIFGCNLEFVKRVW